MHSSDFVNRQFKLSRRFTDGYSRDEIDAFMAKLARAYQTLEAGGTASITGDDVRLAMFNTTRFVQGYNQIEVDDFLDEVADDLNSRLGGAPQRNGAKDSDDGGIIYGDPRKAGRKGPFRRLPE